MAQALNRHAITVMAVKLVQPGRLADVTEGVKRLLNEAPDYAALKKGVHKELELLVEAGFIAHHEGQRYILTSQGESFVGQTGIAYLIEARRMYLLKETRKAIKRERSGTRARSLLQ